MIWQLLGTAINVGGQLLGGALQRKDLREAGQQSYDLAMLQRADTLSAQQQAQNLARDQLGLQQSQARFQRKMAKDQLKQDQIDRTLGFLGSNSALKNNVLNMWSNTGLAK